MATVGEITLPEFQPSDLYFSCQHCCASLRVKATAADPTLECTHCGKSTSIPQPPTIDDSVGKPTPATAEELAERERHLKENESQRTEINGYINQLSIQVHRWQLRLQTLNERHNELTRQIAELSGPKPLSE